MKFRDILLEAYNIDDLNSGMFRSSEVAKKVKEVIAGDEDVTVGNDTYHAVRKITTRSLEEGQIVLAYYSGFNQGAHLFQVLGFTGDDKKYGAGGIKFSSVKEMLNHYNVSSLTELDKLQSKNEYGYKSYMVVKSLETGRSVQLYLDRGRWNVGSDPVSFVLMKKV